MKSCFNTTSDHQVYEENWSVLTVFVSGALLFSFFGVPVWVYLACNGDANSKTSRENETTADWRTTLRENILMFKPVSMSADAEHYLAFLTMCRNLFLLLTIISVFWIAPDWGMQYFLFFLPINNGFRVSIAGQVGSGSTMFRIASITVFESVVAYLFVAKFQVDIMKSLPKQDHESRAIWLRNIPDKDLGTLAQHRLNAKDFERVADDLKNAIFDHMRQRDPPSATQRVRGPEDMWACPLGNGNTTPCCCCPVNHCCCCLRCKWACTIAVGCAWPGCECCGGLFNSGHAAGHSGHAAHLGRTATTMSEPPGQQPMRHVSVGEATHSFGDMQSSMENGCGDAAVSVDTIVETIIVQPVMNEFVRLIDMFNSYKDARSRARTYQRKCEEMKAQLVEEGRQSCTSAAGWYCWMWKWWYDRSRSKWLKHGEELSKAILQFHSPASCPEEVTLPMSGDAFVLFKDLPDVGQAEDDTAHVAASSQRNPWRDSMLKPERRWWEPRDFTPFRFGRPPFTAVTLECRQAPAPADIIWENLHHRPLDVVMNHSVCLLSMLLVMFFVVALIVLSSQRENLAHLCPRDSVGYSCICLAFHIVDPISFGGRLSSLALVTLNSIILPAWIESVAAARKYHLKSRGEILILSLNLTLLVLTKFVIPLGSIVMVDLIKANAELEEQGVDASMLPCVLGEHWDALGDAGVFYLIYTLNCAFVTNILSLLQVGRHLYRGFCLNVIAVTEQHKREANQPFLFAYGYWYAWSLSQVATGLVMGVIVPSTLPITCINFALRLLVDKILLCGLEEPRGPDRVVSSAVDHGPDSRRIYPPRVAHFMFSLISLKLVATGVYMLMQVYFRYEVDEDNVVSAYIYSGFLVFVGIVFWLSSVWSRVQQVLGESFNTGETSTFLYNFGQMAINATFSLTRFQAFFRSRLSEDSGLGTSRLLEDFESDSERREQRSERSGLGPPIDVRMSSRADMRRATVEDMSARPEFWSALKEAQPSFQPNFLWDARKHLLPLAFPSEDEDGEEQETDEASITERRALVDAILTFFYRLRPHTERCSVVHGDGVTLSRQASRRSLSLDAPASAPQTRRPSPTASRFWSPELTTRLLDEAHGPTLGDLVVPPDRCDSSHHWPSASSAITFGGGAAPPSDSAEVDSDMDVGQEEEEPGREPAPEGCWEEQLETQDVAITWTPVESQD